MKPEFETAVNLIHELFSLPVTLLTSRESTDAFCQEYHFHHFQKCFRPGELSALTEQMVPATLYRVADMFQVNLALFLADGIPVCLGPFCTSVLTEYTFLALCRQYSISGLNAKDFLSYQSRFPLISEERIHEISYSFMKNVDRIETLRPVQKLDYTDAISWDSKRIADEEYKEDYYKLLQDRYMIEQRFMKNIERGNSYSALLDYQNMNRSVAFLKQIGTTIENERIGAGIVRTLVRISALKAGIPAATVDALSSQNTRAVQKAKSVETILKEQEKMIRNFCREIHAHHEKKYSSLILSAIYYIEHQFIQSVTVKQIAAELNVTPNHLISRFRAETGMTPLVYLRKVRMKEASVLLASTDRPIQDISSMVGIEDANYFVKLFKKEFNDTPNHYRKSHKL